METDLFAKFVPKSANFCREPPDKNCFFFEFPSLPSINADFSFRGRFFPKGIASKSASHMAGAAYQKDSGQMVCHVCFACFTCVSQIWMPCIDHFPMRCCHSFCSFVSEMIAGCLGWLIFHVRAFVPGFISFHLFPDVACAGF